MTPNPFSETNKIKYATLNCKTLYINVLKFIIHHSSFIIHHSSFIIHHSSFIIHHSSFIIHLAFINTANKIIQNVGFGLRKKSVELFQITVIAISQNQAEKKSHDSGIKSHV